LDGDLGTDGLSITATVGADTVDTQTVTNASPSITKTTPITLRSQTFTRGAFGVINAVSGGVTATILGTSLEKLNFSVLDGADTVIVHDLQGSGVEAYTTDLGLASAEVTEIRPIQRTDANGNRLYLDASGHQTTIP